MRRIIDCLLKVACLFPIFTVCIDNGIINKLLFGSLVFFLLLSFFLYSKIQKYSFIYICAMLVTYVWALFQTSFPISNMNMYFYFPFYIIYSLFMIEKKDYVLSWLKTNKKYIDFIVVIWTCIVGISIFIPSCYYVKEGGSLYFGSYIRSIFRLGPSAVFIQGLALVGMSVYKNKKYILFMIVPLYCYFMGSSRTYLVVGLALFTIAWYWYGARKSVFYMTLIPMIAVGAYVFMHSSMAAKIMFTLDDSQYGDFWFRITSSRSRFWGIDLLAYFNESIINKLFGSGIEFTIKQTGLWGHNDFIEILCSYGLIGLLTYSFINIKIIKSSGFFVTKDVPFFIGVLLLIVWAFNAFFNMHFTYFCCTLIYPIICFSVNYKYKENN